MNDLPNLTIFSAGSYARHEASIHSDIDLFFFSNEERSEVKQPRTKELQLFGKLIEEGRRQHYPPFSRDSEYLSVLHAPDMFLHLGSPKDDHGNYFTLRMLLLLESKCLYGDVVYNDMVRSIVSAYFVDYPNHADSFQPTFLLNDISRFWNTLLLNYENKRGHRIDKNGRRIELTPDQVIEQKVRNLKLKFSRLTTCFATIASLGSHREAMTEDEVIFQTALTPRERLQSIPERVPEAMFPVSGILERYAWFLEQTALTSQDLHDKMRNKDVRKQMFARAEEYGDCFFDLLKVIDTAVPRQRGSLLRYLVI